MTTIFTDGSSRGNPGPGGWGAVIIQDLLHNKDGNVKPGGKIQVIELGGREDHTTNNRMELSAACEALGKVKGDDLITIHTDSSYVVNGITKWVHGWKRNGWKTKTKDDVLNKDLWMELEKNARGKQIEWKRVDGHAGILGNDRCDHIATDMADDMPIRLYKGPLSDYDLPKILEISHDEEMLSAKKSSSSRSRAQAHSYVSSVGGIIKVHYSWAECEKRVKGVKGARYKKSLDDDDEKRVIQEFETI